MRTKHSPKTNKDSNLLTDQTIGQDALLERYAQILSQSIRNDPKAKLLGFPEEITAQTLIAKPSLCHLAAAIDDGQSFSRRSLYDLWEVRQKRAKNIPDIFGKSSSLPRFLKFKLKNTVYEIHQSCSREEDPQWLSYAGMNGGGQTSPQGFRRIQEPIRISDQDNLYELLESSRVDSFALEAYLDCSIEARLRALIKPRLDTNGLRDDRSVDAIVDMLGNNALKLILEKLEAKDKKDSFSLEEIALATVDGQNQRRGENFGKSGQNESTEDEE